MRKGRYRHQMLELSWLEQRAQKLSSVFAQWKSLYETQRISDWEFVGAYLVLFRFLSNPNQPMKRTCINKCIPFDEKSFESLLAPLFSSRLSELNLPKECLRSIFLWIYDLHPQLNGVPGGAISVYQRWRANQLPLRLYFNIPSSTELLTLQMRGERCVSCLVAEKDICRLSPGGRDIWSFCLHDLLHADHFYNESMFPQIQRYLSYFFLQIMSSQWYRASTEMDSQWVYDFEYISADMNAHPVHVFLSFYAKLIEFYKRNSSKPNWETKMDPEMSGPTSSWNEFWRSLLNKTQLVDPFLTPSTLVGFESLLERNQIDQQHHQTLHQVLLDSAARFQITHV